METSLGKAISLCLNMRAMEGIETMSATNIGTSIGELSGIYGRRRSSSGIAIAVAGMLATSKLKAMYFCLEDTPSLVDPLEFQLAVTASEHSLRNIAFNENMNSKYFPVLVIESKRKIKSEKPEMVCKLFKRLNYVKI